MPGYTALQPHFARFGLLQVQPPTLWQGPFELPDPLARFYAQIGPCGDTLHAQIGPVGLCVPGVDVEIPALQRLWALQAGYRWHGVSGEAIADWDSDWLVIADQQADPIIFELGSGRLLFARHGSGRWAPDALAPDLPIFAAVLAAIGTVYLDADEDLRDDDWVVRPAYRAAAMHAASAAVGHAQAEDIFDTLEW